MSTIAMVSAKNSTYSMPTSDSHRQQAAVLNIKSPVAKMDEINSESFAQHVQTLMSAWHVPGLSIAAFDQNQITAKVFGLASIEPSIAATPETIFDCASTTKSLTAAAVAKLVADGHFTWTTPLASLLKDEWVLSDPSVAASTTLEDILSHRSGMPRHDLSYLGQTSRTPDTPRSIVLNLRNLPLSAPPRTKFQYCNMMYTAAAHIVEQTTGHGFAQFLQDKFFDTLGMKSTYVQPSAVVEAGQQHRFSQPYVWRQDGYEQVERRDQPEGQGAGLLQSTAADYARWVQAVMTKDQSLFKDTHMYDDLLRPRILVDPEANEEALPPFTSNMLYALGWEIEFYRGFRIARHDGAETGYGSLILFLPKLDFGLVVMGNAAGAGDVAYILAMGLVDTVLNVAETERVDWAAERVKQNAKDNNGDSDLEKLREELSSGAADDSQAASSPLPSDSYVGTYNHPGYHDIVLQIKDGQLYLDASDRGMPFTIKFEQVGDAGRKFIGHLRDDEGETGLIRAEFDVDTEGHVQRIGLELCWEIKPELIWFRRCS